MSMACKSAGHGTDVVDVIYQTCKTVYDHISKRELKIWRGAEYF